MKCNALVGGRERTQRQDTACPAWLAAPGALHAVLVRLPHAYPRIVAVGIQCPDSEVRIIVPRPSSANFGIKGHWQLTDLVVQFQHSHPNAAGTFANVGIDGPLENIDSSGALDLTFASRDRGHQHSERQIRSTSVALVQKSA